MARVAQLLCALLPAVSAFAPSLAAPRLATAAATPQLLSSRAAVSPVCTLLLAEEAAASPELLSQLQAFQDSHAFIIGIIVAILSRALINEARYRIEKPVMDELGERAKSNLTPDTERIGGGQWSQLALCVALDLAGDASELIPFLGEFTDLAYAPVEAALLKGLFKSNLIAGFGFVEEILPFTDLVPTFTLSWCLSTLWPTTPLAKKLLPAKAA